MTLSDLASIGSFISGVGVLASLIYLSLQIRQNTKHSRALIQQGRVTRIVDASLHRAEPTLAAIALKGGKGEQPLDEIEFSQFMNLQQGRFINAEESFVQHRNGLLEDASFNTFVLTHQHFMTAPGNRAMWKLMRSQYDPRYATFMDALAQEGSNQRSASLFAQWPSALVQEREKAGQSAARIYD